LDSRRNEEREIVDGARFVSGVDDESFPHFDDFSVGTATAHTLSCHGTYITRNRWNAGAAASVFSRRCLPSTVGGLGISFLLTAKLAELAYQPLSKVLPVLKGSILSRSYKILFGGVQS
jgi:hypothetical protein